MIPFVSKDLKLGTVTNYRIRGISNKTTVILDSYKQLRETINNLDKLKQKMQLVIRIAKHNAANRQTPYKQTSDHAW